MLFIKLSALIVKINVPGLENNDKGCDKYENKVTFYECQIILINNYCFLKGYYLFFRCIAFGCIWHRCTRYSRVNNNGELVESDSEIQVLAVLITFNSI